MRRLSCPTFSTRLALSNGKKPTPELKELISALDFVVPGRWIDEKLYAVGIEREPSPEYFPLPIVPCGFLQCNHSTPGRVSYRSLSPLRAGLEPLSFTTPLVA